jgi:cell division transport system ATP-binding protein
MALFDKGGRSLGGRAKNDGGNRPFAFFRAGLGQSQTAQNRPILVLEDVFKYHRPDQPTLRGVNLSVERGEFVFITGPSGAGKSTLLDLVYRKQQVDEGRILFSGRDISRLTSDSIPYLRRNLGIVFQDFKVIGHWTVFENVAIALEILSMPRRLIRSRVSEALERVGLAGRGEDTTGNLSGGEQQRVAVARAIVTEPALLLADEPTGNLDPHLALDILTLFEEIHATGTTVLFATHDHTLLEERAHRIVYIDDGNVKEARKGLTDWSTMRAAEIQSASSPGTQAAARNNNVVSLARSR